MSKSWSIVCAPTGARGGHQIGRFGGPRCPRCPRMGRRVAGVSPVPSRLGPEAPSRQWVTRAAAVH